MVRGLNSGSSGPGWVLAGDIVLCSWARHINLTVPLSAQAARLFKSRLTLFPD